MDFDLLWFEWWIDYDDEIPGDGWPAWIKTATKSAA
jgi:hypothetical protein